MLFKEKVKQYFAPLLVVFLSEFIILFCISFLSPYFFPGSRTSSLTIWESWNVWDVKNYVSIASSGYQKFGPEAAFIVLPPFFPILIFTTNILFHSGYLISGFITSFIITLLLAIIFYKLVLIDHPKQIAGLTILLLFIFPTSFFLHIPYSESLFILLSIGAFYFVRMKHYWISFLLVGLATFTRIAGLALVPAILTEILIMDKNNFRKKVLSEKITIILLGLLISLSGFIFYLYLNHFLWGDFFYFITVQKQNYYENFAPFGQGLIGAFKSLSWRGGLEKFMLGYMQISDFVLALVTSIYVLIRVRLSYGIFMLSNLWFPYSMSFWICMPRYILTLFPMYIALAIFSKNLIFRYIWISMSSILLILFGLIFLQYGPVL